MAGQTVSCLGNPPDWDLRKLAVGAIASSFEQEHTAVFAFDDDTGTRWSSEWNDNQWISIDLGKPCTISKIELLWEDAFAQEYNIEISHDTHIWKAVRQIQNGSVGKISFAFNDLVARYVRVNAIKRGSQWGFSLKEFIIYGPVNEPEPEYGGLVRPRKIVTIFDHNYADLSKMFAKQSVKDPENSKNMSDDEFLDLIEKRAFDFFWYEAHPETFFIIDSTTWKARTSNAAIGFQLGAYIAGHYRRYKPRDEIYKRVETLLDHCLDDPNDPNDLHLEHHYGWTYHWVDIETGKWRGEEHICTHDSITYLCGVIAAKHYFKGTLAGEIATQILESVKWDWIIHGGRNKKFVSNAYAHSYNPPCGGEVRFYDGMKFDYLFPIGAQSNAISPIYWHNYALDYPWDFYKGHFWRIERPAPWCHQWDHVWFDFQYMKDDYADYHQNSVEATLANRQWCIDNDSYNANLWGVGPSRGPGKNGGAFYKSYGAPPDDLPYQKGVDNDKTISPTATLPSIQFAPEQVIRVARHMYDNYKNEFWKRYGFPDAMNPGRNWFDKEYIAIDQGPIVINIENYRSGLIYDLFAKEDLIWNGLHRAGFMGIVDNFDESEHSPAYGVWHQVGPGNIFQFEKTSDRVKEGRYSLRINHDLSQDTKQRFFAVRPGRKDFSPYTYLTLWVFNDPGLKPVLVTADKNALPLTLKARRGSRTGWTRLYFELPAAVRSGDIAEVCFSVEATGKNVFWLDGILLTHEIPEAEWDFMIDDFDQGRLQWSADPAYDLECTSEHVKDGRQALKVGFRKSGEKDRWASIALQPPITDWSLFHSMAMWVHGETTLLIKLEDKEGRSFNVDTKSVNKKDGWKHLFFNIQANLNPENCWEPRYDKRNIKTIQLIFEPGKTDCNGKIYIDSIMLTE